MRKSFKSWPFRLVWCGASALPLLTAHAHADDVHLEGGSVLEGKAVRHADKVTVELEAGTITLSADTVRRIDKRESSVQRYDRLYAALGSDDVAGRISLANFCREHDMRARERSVLQEVIDRDPAHTEARTRLGYVKGPDGWVTLEQDYRARGMVQYEGTWMPQERALELTRLHHEAELARQEQERGRVQLDAERAAAQQAQADARRPPASPSETQTIATPVYYGAYGAYGGWQRTSQHVEPRVFAPLREAPPPRPAPAPVTREKRAAAFVAPRARNGH